MSIEDEIRTKKEKMQADMREADRKKQEAERLSNALKDAGMKQNYPVLIVPASELQPIISEAMPNMRFSYAKIVRTMPDGRTLARAAKNNEHPDMYSFDAVIFSDGTGKGSSTYKMWIFNNGAISFVNNDTSNLTWANVRSKGVDATTVRGKIIDALASQAIQNEKKVESFHSSSSNEKKEKSTYSSPTKTNNVSASNKSSSGCYIATAVYGSYDCPEVWVLRRYRDYSLKHSSLGRLFVRIYYAVSPTLVKWFGEKAWFKLQWRKYLDKKVAVLKEAGYSDDQYED